MDTITDILSTLFVSASHKPRSHRPIKSSKKSSSHEHIQIQHSEDSDITTCSETFTHTDNQSIEVSEESIESQSSKEVSQESIESQSKQKENQSTKEVLQEQSKEVSQESIESQSTEEVLQEQSKVSQNESEEIKLQKMVMRASDISKKNIILANVNLKENLALLGELLHNISLMKDVQNIYTGTVTIVCNTENKKYYKKLMIENPYLYFTDFIVTKNFSQEKQKGILQSDKRSLLIVDCDENADQKAYNNIIDSGANVQVIFVMTNLSNAQLYTSLPSNKMLIHKKQSLKSLQKLFFNSILKNICDVHMTFNDYFKLVNQDTFAVRYIVVNNGNLRYL
jgi:hypothetical protein